MIEPAQLKARPDSYSAGMWTGERLVQLYESGENDRRKSTRTETLFEEAMRLCFELILDGQRTEKAASIEELLALWKRIDQTRSVRWIFSDGSFLESRVANDDRLVCWGFAEVIN